MSFVKRFLFLIAAVVAADGLRAENNDFLWGWSVSGGANFGFGLKTDLKTSPANAMKNLPALHPSVGPSRQEALKTQKPVPGGDRVVYGADGDGDWYVDPSSSWGETEPNETINWRLPDSMRQGGSFVVESGDWGEVVGESVSASDVGGSESDVAYGASVELSHGLWASESGTWGVDIAFGLSWMRANNCYRSSGIATTRSAEVERGNVRTEIPADCLEDPYAGPEDDDTWGGAAYDGSQTTGRRDYIIDLSRISSVAQTLSGETYSDSMSLHSHGDYEEWEISVLLRPWYDINEWLCVHGSFGIGITRSSFDYSMEAICNGASIYRSSEEFHEWRCYGIAGAGLLARFWDFDVSCDGLFRWCQDDMEINGKDVKGTIDKPWGVVRLGLSYNF